VIKNIFRVSFLHLLVYIN